MFELEGYTMPDFPERDEGQYPIAMVSLDSSGGCAYLTFADKAGYIIKLIAGDVWTGNAYTLGLTPEDTYDESKVIYEQSYVVMLDEAYKDALELLYPGITTTAWLRYTPSSTQTPSGGYYSLAMNYGPQWTNTDLYDEDGNLFLSAAGKKFPLREWLSWRIYGLCSRPLPMGQKQDVLDNEWPIQFNTDAITNNTYFLSDDLPYYKVSSLVVSPEELKKMGQWYDGDTETVSPFYYDIDKVDSAYPNVRFGGACVFVLATTEIEGQTVEPGVYYMPYLEMVMGVAYDVTIGYLPHPYLYGTANLEHLPEWDTATYPYAILKNVGSVNDAGLYLYFTQYPFTRSSSFVRMTESGAYQEWLFDNGSWRYSGSGTSRVSASHTKVKWTNHDILESDGTTIYLAASDPVPVYE